MHSDRAIDHWVLNAYLNVVLNRSSGNGSKPFSTFLIIAMPIYVSSTCTQSDHLHSSSCNLYLPLSERRGATKTHIEAERQPVTHLVSENKQALVCCSQGGQVLQNKACLQTKLPMLA